MAALTGPRDTQARFGGNWTWPVAAGAKIFAGALVVLQAGVARPGFTGTGLMAAGRADATADNTDGADGAIPVKVSRGVFSFASAGAADAVTAVHIGRTVHIVDDQTVALTDGGGTRSAAGRVMGVDGRGVWVEIV
jgi:hypothetical protein